MRLKVENCANKSLKKYIGEAMSFYSKELFHPNMHKNIHVTVRFCKLNYETYAEAFPTSYSKKPRNFVVKLRNDLKKPVLALAHEMIHIKQYAKGELCLYHTKWKNTRVSQNTPYKDLPWEKEAYRKDYQLYKKFKIFFNKKPKM